MGGCRTEPPPPTPLDANCEPPVGDAGTPSCALPAALPPSEVDDWDEFLATASALVCRGAIRENLPILIWDSWCHPRFARLYLERYVPGLPAFPTREARACLAELEVYGVDVAYACLDLLTCAAPGECCAQRAAEGEACGTAEDCLRDYTCEDHVCRRSIACGEAGCPFRDGLCERPPCALPVRFGGEPCGCHEDCASGYCERGTCSGLRPIGCGCGSDEDCPSDVAVCLGEGVCVARPMLGEPCIDGAPCFGSACVGGVCSRIPEGEGGCANSRECEEGLVCVELPCSGPFCVPPRVCATPQPPPGLGMSCEAGGCAPGLRCREGICQPLPAPGDPCTTASECAELACLGGRCVARPREGEHCDAVHTCARLLVCHEGLCRAEGGAGAPCESGRCNAAHRCVAGLCHPRIPIDSPCRSTEECVAEAACIEGVCRPRPTVGQTCPRLGDCALGAECWDGLCYGPACRP